MVHGHCVIDYLISLFEIGTDMMTNGDGLDLIKMTVTEIRIDFIALFQEIEIKHFLNTTEHLLDLPDYLCLSFVN